MTILVIGGTGFVGICLTNLLVDKGHEFTIMSRHPQVGPDFGSSVSLFTR